MKQPNRFIVELVSMLVLCVLILAFVQVSRQVSPITRQVVAAAEKLIGLHFSDAERDSLLENVRELTKRYEQIRAQPLNNAVSPALQFNPIPVGKTFETTQKPIDWGPAPEVTMPERFEDLAYYSVRELAELLRTRQVTSTQLTRLYLNRLKKYDPQLKCVITLTEDLALQQARRADEEIAAGHYRGPLHGIPFGAKDLLAVRGYPTTWGAMPYKDQVIDQTATVVKKLEDAGAVLVAKLSLGALAWGDVWYGGKTRNPWNLKQGSSGSSAGSAAATSAGLVAFAIGSETWGSIVSPSTRCAVTGLRPTYGRVSRHGAMALSWSMDKLGPIARSAEDCALIFEAIRGPDGLDQTVVDLPFNYNANLDLHTLRVGYLPQEFEKDSVRQQANQAALEKLQQMGIELIPVHLPKIPVYALSFILDAEAAAAFDELTRNGRDSLMVRQIRNAWPNVFRAARFIPAVEYIQANRLRHVLIQEMNKIFQTVDVYVAPPFGKNLLLTNLTGHPCVVVPNGRDAQGNWASLTFIGDLYDEASILALARAYQQATGFHRLHPPLFP